jgi:DNA-binding transcriptional LysR family regulator
MVAVRVSEPSRFLAVASPAYLAANGAPGHPSDLARHNCIQLRTKAGLYPWTFVERGHKVEAKVSGALVSDDGNLVLRAAVDGVGVAYVVQSHAETYLASGALEPLLEPYAAPFPGFFLYYPSRRHMPAPLKLFAEFLSEKSGRRPPPRRLSIPAEQPMSILEDYAAQPGQ